MTVYSSHIARILPASARQVAAISVNNKMQLVKNGPVNLHVSISGPVDAPVVMFSNSLGTDIRVWDSLLQAMKGAYRVVRYDSRGHGLSDCPEGPYTIDQLTDDAVSIVTELNLKNIHFVGLSIGGLIGQRMAASRPDLLRSLVLMDTAAKIGTLEMWQERISALRRNGLEPMAELILDRWFVEPFRVTGISLPLMCNMLMRTPLEGYVSCCDAIAHADLRDSTSKLQLPVLAMAGEHDTATPPLIVEETAKLCGAEFHKIKGAAHLPCVDEPKQTAALLDEFLSRVTA